MVQQYKKVNVYFYLLFYYYNTNQKIKR